MTADQDLSARLAELRTKATDVDLHPEGRYFDCGDRHDLTQCSHGDTGNYSNKRDGQFIAELWNAYRSGQLITLADHERAVQAAVADARLEMINSLKDEIARQEGEGGEGSSLWCVIDGERTIHEIHAQELMDARVQAAVAKAVEAERESCAKLPVRKDAPKWLNFEGADIWRMGWRAAMKNKNAAIRARKGDAL